jgi:D-proline reductase (dithiol) PrdB
VSLDYLPIMARRTAKPRKLVQPSRLAWHPPGRSAASARIALLTSSAIRRASQSKYTPPDDASYRIIPADPAVADLEIDHRSPVGADARRDPEIVFPRTALTALANQGLVGSVAPNHFSFLGAIRLHRELEEELAPALARELAQAGVDLAVLVPY